MKVEIKLDWKSDFPKARKAALVTDSNVDRLYGDTIVRQIEDTGLQVERIVFPAGEKSKTLETYAELVRGFAALELTRTDFAIALGGGVVGDLTGFAAATYMRGIGFVQIPTTLLAMVDSSIGGKTGVDIPEGKNLVGAFHLPKRILRDVKFLETLPEKEMKNGLAEMIKTAVLFDAEMFAALERLVYLDNLERLEKLEPLVDRCAAWKQKIVDEDFKEGGKRKLLNLGHTFGHAIEKLSDFTVTHGCAVATGLAMAARAAVKLGVLSATDGARIESLLAAMGYETRSRFAADDLAKAMGGDKKAAAGSVDLILPTAIGTCMIRPTSLGDLSALCQEQT